MITNTRQDWTPGSTVKVGFLKLTVVNFNGLAYRLKSANGTQYEFEPHRGLYRCD